MSKQPQVILALQSPHASHQWSFGTKVLAALKASDPRLWPARVGRDDGEMRKKLPCETVADLEPLWAQEADATAATPKGVISTLFLKRAKPLQAHTSINFMSENARGDRLSSTFTLQSKFDPKIDYLGLFEALCALYRPSRGYLHLVVPQDRWQGGEVALSENDSQRMIQGLPPVNPDLIAMQNWDHFGSGSFGALWDPRTFNLGQTSYVAATDLTPDTVARLGAENINVTGSDDGYYIRLAETLESVRADFPTFSHRRKLAKEIIGLERFEIKAEQTA